MRWLQQRASSDLEDVCRIGEPEQALKDKGFYYGTVDGQPGPETDAAIRRYQIRQGLEVTGKLDARTVSSLGVGGSAQQNGNTLQAVPPPADQSANAQPAPAPEQTPPPDVVQSDHDILRNTPPAPAPATEEETAPQPRRWRRSPSSRVNRPISHSSPRHRSRSHPRRPPDRTRASRSRNTRGFSGRPRMKSRRRWCKGARCSGPRRGSRGRDSIGAGSTGS